MPVFAPDKIKDARLDAGISRRDLARAVGRSVVAVKTYESGTRDVPASVLGLLARVLDVDVDAFYIPDEVRHAAAG